MGKILNIFIISILFIKISINNVNSEIKILYKVNNEIITSYDIENESDYLKALNKNLEDVPDSQLINTATQSLIREKIKKKEIDRVFEIDYEKAGSTNRIDNLIKNIYSNLGYTSEKEFFNFLLTYKINENDLRNKLIIENMWNQLIVNKYNSLIKIDEKKINKEVDDLINNKKEVISFNLSEIVYFEKTKIENEKKLNQIKKSIEKIGFEETAILYSISESAKLGGKIGWVDGNQVSKKIIDEINKLDIGEYSEIISTAGGNIILKLNEKKRESKKINRNEEINKLIKFKKNQMFTEYSIIYYKELENKAYIEKF